jgi:hypothetical protein
MQELRLLTVDEKISLADVFITEFDNSAIPFDANVIGVFEDNEIIGFTVAETLLRVGLIWTKPKIRQTMKSAVIAKEMVNYAYKSIPQGASVIVISSDAKFEKLLTKLGMTEVEGKVFRKDF